MVAIEWDSESDTVAVMNVIFNAVFLINRKIKVLSGCGASGPRKLHLS